MKEQQALCARCRVEPVDEALGVPGCRRCANEVLREELENQPPRATAVSRGQSEPHEPAKSQHPLPR